MTTHFRTCPLCEAMCGLEIETDGERVTRVRGDRADVWSKGFLCTKGAALGELHHDPDRIRVPMVRDGDEWREVTWPEAFARCEQLLHPVVAAHGMSAVTVYMGNPNVHSYSLSRYSGAIPSLGGIKITWSSGTVDQWPKNVVCAQLFGGAWSIPIPDVAHTDLLVIMGANPHASNGSPTGVASTPIASARWPENWPARRAPLCTAESVCATKSSARSLRGWWKSSTSSRGTSVSRAAHCSRDRRSQRSPPRPVGAVPSAPDGGTRVCGAHPRCWVKRRCRVWPKRSPRPAKGKCAPSSRSRAIPCCRHPTPAGSTTLYRCSTP